MKGNTIASCFEQGWPDGELPPIIYLDSWQNCQVIGTEVINGIEVSTVAFMIADTTKQVYTLQFHIR